MMYTPNQTPMAIKYRDSEEARRAQERIENIKRLIHYNNKRVRAGLLPVEIPRALWQPMDRDTIRLLTR